MNDKNGECYKIVDTFKVEPPAWDVNRDGDINIFDLVMVASKLGVFDKVADVNQDGTVDVLDMALIASHFGESYIYTQTPASPPLNIDLNQTVKIVPKVEIFGSQNRQLKLSITAESDEVEYISALQFDLSFPPKTLELVEVKPGLLGENAYWQPPQVDSKVGRAANMALVKFGPSKNPDRSSNSETLATATFKVLNPFLMDDLSDIMNNLKVSNVILSDSKTRSIRSEVSPSLLLIDRVENKIQRFEAFQNYPNPFNPETWIPYQLPQAAEVAIRIFDSSGKSIRTIRLGMKEPGIYIDKNRAAYWDGKNNKGELVSSGIYFYTIEAAGPGFQLAPVTKKMTMEK